MSVPASLWWEVLLKDLGLRESVVCLLVLGKSPWSSQFGVVSRVSRSLLNPRPALELEERRESLVEKKELRGGRAGGKG